MLDVLRTAGVSFELLVVDDGSEDGTAELTRAVAAGHSAVRLVQVDHGGKAHALIHGMRAAQGRIVLFSDMDQAIPIAEASKLLPWFDQGFDIVIGSRGFERKHASLSRRAISYGQLLARSVVLGFSDIVDTQCGFKAFRREIVGPTLRSARRVSPRGDDTRVGSEPVTGVRRRAPVCGQTAGSVDQGGPHRVRSPARRRASNESCAGLCTRVYRLARDSFGSSTGPI